MPGDLRMYHWGAFKGTVSPEARVFVGRWEGIGGLVRSPVGRLIGTQQPLCTLCQS